MTQGTAAKKLILGTAGHVDHGKTTLITALTGTNPDRLREEQERGMTIDLGFAHVILPSGVQIGIVDVPGHERFLKNMLAGAGGIDLALLVVAADEGVMPQTREHLEILELLETRHGVVALTKIDQVEPDWLGLVEDELSTYLKNTFLADASIVRVSAATGAGLDTLIDELDKAAADVQQRSVDGPFRMPVDRVFSMTGFGTVATGSLVAGTLRIGDPIQVLPEKLDTRARQIQVHGKKVDFACAGTRVAVNLAGLGTDELGRGSVLSPPGFMEPTKVVDASVMALSSSSIAIKNRTRIRLHIGSAETIGRAIVLGAEEVAPGSRGFLQIRLESPVAAARGDRFVLRLYSPTHLLGGGVVLDPSAVRHRRTDPAVTARLQHILEGDPVCVVEDALAATPAGIAVSELARVTQLSADAAAQAVVELSSAGKAVATSGRVASVAALAASSARVKAAVEAYHEAYPARPGMPREELRAQFGHWLDQKGFAFLLGLMAESGEIASFEALVRLPDHKPTLTPAQQRIAEQIERDYLTGDTNPPLLQDTEKRYGAAAREIVPLLIDQGKLVRVSSDILFHSKALSTTEEALHAYLKERGQMTVAEFRDLIGSSRKYVVPLLEYFDAKGVTSRRGDLRVLRE